jgi:hypothetical protein
MLPGFSLLVVVACAAWALGQVVDPRVVVTALVLLILGFLTFTAIRFEHPLRISGPSRIILQIFLVGFVVVAAKSLWSPGPAGELYGGTVSRSLEVGDRSDSRIPYHVVQLVAHGSSPYSPVARANFLPYNFSDRGPLAGLAASPITILTGAKIPMGTPSQPWEPFDPEGYAAYRLAMGALGLTVLLCLGGLVLSLVGPDAAIFITLVAATTPFVIHEGYFTWPKLLTTAFLLMTAHLVLGSRYLLAGLCFGAAYLCHPLALLSAPTILLLAILSVNRGRQTVKWTPPMSAVIGLGTGTGALLLLWRLVNGSHYEQSRFLSYFHLVNGFPTHSVAGWISGRATDTLNTLVPGYVVLRHSADPSLNAYMSHSSGLVHFFFQYWTSLPFAFGLLGYGVFLIVILQTAVRSPWVFTCLIAIPIALFTIYWGNADTGMMREGLQPWLFGVLAVWAWLWYRSPLRGVSGSRGVRQLLGLRAVEVLAMMLVPAAANQHGLWQREFAITDVFALLLIVTGLCWLGWQLAQQPLQSDHGSGTLVDADAVLEVN